MRLRNVKNANIIIENSPYIVHNPTVYKKKWQSLFNNANSIHLEIGMGKGRFIKEKALRYPNINFIGIEKYSSVMARAIQHIGDAELSNLKLICIDALNLENLFDHEIDVIYLNFSDPWPKDRHAKRRLTSDLFLTLYDKIFKGNHEIILKTDNYNLYLYSLDQFNKYLYQIHASNFGPQNMPSDNVMTEFEERFLKLNNTIYQIIAKKHK